MFEQAAFYAVTLSMVFYAVHFQQLQLFSEKIQSLTQVGICQIQGKQSQQLLSGDKIHERTYSHAHR